MDKKPADEPLTPRDALDADLRMRGSADELMRERGGETEALPTAADQMPAPRR